VLSAVSGQVLFGGLATGIAAPTPIDMELRLGGWSIGAWPVALDQYGVFHTTIPPKIVDVSVKPTHWLRKTVTLDARLGDVDWVPFELANGDASGDNAVNMLDLGLVLTNFATSDPMSDLNGDGSVGLTDIGIVLTNFTMTGDP